MLSIPSLFLALSGTATSALAPCPQTGDEPRGTHADPRPEVQLVAPPDAAWQAGTALELVLTFEGADPRWWGDPADVAVPRPILQLDVPPSVRLVGAPPTERVTPRDYELGYLRYPEGRKLHAAETRVAFQLLAAPGPEERLGLNLVYWLDGEDGLCFLRQRLELPLAPGARAEAVDPTDTRWGSHAPLSVGDTPELALESHDGFEISLADYRGAPLVVATYRAHW